MENIVNNISAVTFFTMGLLIYLFSKQLYDAFSVPFSFKANNKNEGAVFTKGLGIMIMVISVVKWIMDFQF